jgi:hypothetical protein
MFCRRKDWRRIATRYDSNIINFMAATLRAGSFRSSQGSPNSHSQLEGELKNIAEE